MSDLFPSVIDPYQILGPTSSRLANPGELPLVICSMVTLELGTIAERELVLVRNLQLRNLVYMSHVTKLFI